MNKRMLLWAVVLLVIAGLIVWGIVDLVHWYNTVIGPGNLDCPGDNVAVNGGC